jgi:SAM-dependent methyltransferase
MTDTYTHGHHESVLRSHKWRTAENSAGYLLDRLQPGQQLLDVGCGPGTITLDLAARVAPGKVFGLDPAADVIEQAEAARQSAGVANVTFATGDVYALEFDDASFDVVHAHQVLQHLTDPVKALVEIGRVLRPGGTLAVRDGDYGTFVWAPDDPLLDRWLALYHQVTSRNLAEADAGRRLPGWVRAAGYADVVVSTSTWTFADPDSRQWWGRLWADRVRLSSFAGQAVAYGLSTPEELGAISRAWDKWSESDDGFFALINVEVLARG